jgi:hypothetical protein
LSVMPQPSLSWGAWSDRVDQACGDIVVRADAPERRTAI